MGSVITSKNEHKVMSNYLADTTVIIDHLRGNNKATVFLENFAPNISIVTMAELIQGSRDRRDQNFVVKTCASLSELSIDKKISEKAITFMKEFYLSNGLQFLDAVIAATAILSRLILVTNNTKHFRFIHGLEVLSHSEAFKKS